MCVKLSIMRTHKEAYIKLVTLKASDSTAQAYNRDIEQFMAFLEGFRITTPKKLNQSVVVDYFFQLQKAGRAEATIRRKYEVIKAFCRYIERRDVFEDVEPPKKAPFKIHVPSVDTMQKLIELPDVFTLEGCRDRAIMELLYSSGLRASELCDLTVGDACDFQVRIENSKGNKTRTVPITGSAQYWINGYLNKYRLDCDVDEYLFLQQNGRRISRSFLHRLVEKYAAQINLKNFSVHTFRHACATHLLESGADIRFLQALLGHAQLEITARYATVTSSGLANTFNLNHPREKNAINNGL